MIQRTLRRAGFIGQAECRKSFGNFWRDTDQLFAAQEPVSGPRNKVETLLILRVTRVSWKKPALLITTRRDEFILYPLIGTSAFLHQRSEILMETSPAALRIRLKTSPDLRCDNLFPRSILSPPGATVRREYWPRERAPLRALVNKRRRITASKSAPARFPRNRSVEKQRLNIANQRNLLDSGLNKSH